MRVWAFLAACAVVGLAVPPGLAADPWWRLDLTTTAPAGTFVAYRFELVERAVIEFGAIYGPVASDQPALPVAVWKQNPRGLWGASYVLRELEPTAPGTHDTVHTPYGDLQAGELASTQGGGHWTTASFVEKGVYTVVVATAPAQGEATLFVRVGGGAARLLASDTGASFYARGYDHSAWAYDVEARLPADVYLRAWYYSGATLPLDVQGRLYGLMSGYTPAHWASPDGATFSQWVLAEPGGAWQAVFPEEEWHRPICAPGGEWGCDVFHDEHVDPPFTLAADVRLP